MRIEGGRTLPGAFVPVRLWRMRRQVTRLVNEMLDESIAISKIVRAPDPIKVSMRAILKGQEEVFTLFNMDSSEEQTLVLTKAKLKVRPMTLVAFCKTL